MKKRSNGEADQGASLSLDQQLCFAVYSCANRISRLYRVVLQPLGITFTQYLVLLALWDKDSRNISELAQVLDLEPNTVTPMVKRIESLGLVVRSRHPSDERQVRVAVTQKGLDLRKDVIAIRQDLIDRLDMPMDEIVQVREIVKHFSDKVSLVRD